MENWCTNQRLCFVCNTLSNGRNHSYGISSKIKESSNFQEGMATMRQLSFGLLDMGWHGQDPSSITDIKAFEIEQFAATKLYPEVKMMSTLSLIFSRWIFCWDITATSGLKFSMLTLLNSSKKRNLQ
jgi:Zn-dependent oligopeptidase